MRALGYKRGRVACPVQVSDMRVRSGTSTGTPTIQNTTGSNDPYNDTTTSKPRPFQSVFCQWYDFAHVVVRITLPPTSQLDLGAVEEGIADCSTRYSTAERRSRIEENLPMRSSSS